MNTFLDIVAKDMLAQYGCDMHDITVVFPGKRAGMFLARTFARQAEGTVWTPECKTIGELFGSLTNLRKSDIVENVCLLHTSICEVLGSDFTESLDEFWSWGEVLLADFDDIDKHLGQARDIFTNVTDLERLSTIDYLTDSQEEKLREFFGEFALEKRTRIKEEFLRLWEHMYDIYTTFHQRLLAKDKLYEGALYRQVIEQLKADPTLVDRLTMNRRAIVFAGFNVINDVEEALMKAIGGKARFYWDYDVYYTTQHPDNEAGYFMSANIKKFGSAIQDPSAFDHLSHLKDVTFITCKSDNAAARYANTWIAEHTKDEGDHTRKAIVLANEQLMQPVLHAIPEDLDAFNVTMGFPLSNTPVFGLLNALIRLQTEGYDEQRSRFRSSFKQTLRHQPFFQYLTDETWNTYEGQSTERLITYLMRVMREAAQHFACIEEPGIYEQLYNESLYRADNVLGQLLDLVQDKEQPFELQTFTLCRLMRSMLSSISIPFHSEPDQGLQMMGILETRQLDFADLLLLSVEEGMLPRSTQNTSFIPPLVRQAFGLTTDRHRISVYAYYFYRLIQRTEHLTCIYNENCSDGTQHEMSRFLRQLLAETDIDIQVRELKCDPSCERTEAMHVEKTDEVMQYLLNRYDLNTNNKGKLLSPSAINTYMRCRLWFYLEHVLGIRCPEEPEEGLTPAMLGDIFHDTAECFYKQFGTEEDITASMLCDAKGKVKPSVSAQLEALLDAAFDVIYFCPPTEEGKRNEQIMARLQSHPDNEYTGSLLIAKDVLRKYLHHLLEYDAMHAPFRIIGIEEYRTVDIPVGDVLVRSGGRFDRMDNMGGIVRIVDYKTGTHVPEDVTMAKVIGQGAKHENYYFQAFLYALAEMQSPEAKGKAVKPVLFYPAKATTKDYDPTLSLGKDKPVDDFASISGEYEAGLKAAIAEIFNPDVPFDANGDKDSTCKWCKLQLFCKSSNS